MSDKIDKKRFSVTFTELHLEILDNLVTGGFYVSPQAAIRAALMLLAQHHGVKPFSQKEEK